MHSRLQRQHNKPWLTMGKSIPVRAVAERFWGCVEWLKSG